MHCVLILSKRYRIRVIGSAVTQRGSSNGELETRVKFLHKRQSQITFRSVTGVVQGGTHSRIKALVVEI